MWFSYEAASRIRKKIGGPMNAKSDIRFTRCMPVWSIRPQRTVKEFTVFNADNGRIKLKLIFILEYLMNVCKSNAKMKLISPHAIFVPVQRSWTAVQTIGQNASFQEGETLRSHLLIISQTKHNNSSHGP